MTRDCCRRIECVSSSFWRGAALAFLILVATSPAHATRSCLDPADATPPQMLVQDGAGCWTYDPHLPRTEAPSAIREMIIVVEEPGLPDPIPDFLLDEEELATTMGQFVLFVSFVLATASGLAAARPDNGIRHRTPVHRSW